MAVILLTDETQLCFVASASLVKATYYISNHSVYTLRFQNHKQTSYIIPTTFENRISVVRIRCERRNAA
jgi:hypothetical protein